MVQRKSEFKPLLFTTTLRNPKRAKSLLNILSRFNNQVLTNELAKKIMWELIRYWLYRPTRWITKEIEEKWGSKRISDSSTIWVKILNDDEVNKLLIDNPQDHKEAWFEKWWWSRFATVFDFPKELWFVYFWLNEKIEFSKIWLMLANSVEIEIDDENYILFSEIHPEFEQQAFLHALAKSQRNNPFVRVLNENIPLILLLEVIQKLNNDKDFNDVWISKLELPLIIFWKDNNSQKLYELIKEIRKDYWYNPSPEVIINICVNKIMLWKFKEFDPKSIISDYPDEFIRKMRLTWLISLRWAWRFIDINKNEQSKVDYILKTYSKYTKFETEREYFDYMAKTDENLISLTTKQITVEENNKYLDKWLEVYNWNRIKEELMILAQKKLSKDDLLKYLANPVRLEFLTSLAVKSKFPHIKVIPNYPCDDEWIPTSTAWWNWNKWDIECFENDNWVLIEVTMAEWRTQTMMEVWPIWRHLEEFSKKSKKSMCYFIAPSIFKDSERQIKFLKDEDWLFILAKKIEDFLSHLENESNLYCKW